jgi:hypothetical protein
MYRLLLKVTIAILTDPEATSQRPAMVTVQLQQMPESPQNICAKNSSWV